MGDRGEVTLLAVGDLFINRSNPVSIFDGVREALSGADILIGNQEGTVTDRGAPLPGKIEAGSIHHRAGLGGIEGEAEVGFSAVSLANNHTMDYGPEGMFHTMEQLDAHGVGYMGAGATIKDARRPLILERKGLKVAVLAYTSVFPPYGYRATENRPGVATVKVHTAFQPTENVFYQPGYPPIIVTTPDGVETEDMLRDIRQAREVGNLVVVQFHWGIAQSYERVTGYMKEMGRAAIDAGADLILGHHPHLLLGFEFYRERLICYSLGHFAFDVFAPFLNWYDTLILRTVIRDGRFDRFAVIPAILKEQGMDLAIAEGIRRRTILERLEGLSREFGTELTTDGVELVLSGPVPGTPPPLRAPEVLADSLFQITYPTSRQQGLKAVVKY